MPVFLLLVFAVTALEVGSIKKHHEAATKTLSTKGTAPKTDTATEAAAVQRAALVQSAVIIARPRTSSTRY
ncbi:hypothetical protein ACHAPT_003545 [Fusarium lateritium]